MTKVTETPKAGYYTYLKLIR